jgi:hypothetical protein
MHQVAKQALVMEIKMFYWIVKNALHNTVNDGREIPLDTEYNL